MRGRHATSSSAWLRLGSFLDDAPCARHVNAYGSAAIYLERARTVLTGLQDLETEVRHRRTGVEIAARTNAPDLAAYTDRLGLKAQELAHVYAEATEAYESASLLLAQIRDRNEREDAIWAGYDADFDEAAR